MTSHPSLMDNNQIESMSQLRIQQILRKQRCDRVEDVFQTWSFE